ncbi:hypothetical protein [Pseudomonas sp. FP2338]|uniref:hypothetical protein n=1 Tax=Pseudomonas sp. FP2338 TaxID=2954093 RepID=UPI0027324DF3|nr:hypothetical protein [Pseudomonas sp. FP2338]WLH84131.1 hypothetical protein PSH96_25545 [Pseudomonas sp. FP2338]
MNITPSMLPLIPLRPVYDGKPAAQSESYKVDPADEPLAPDKWEVKSKNLSFKWWGGRGGPRPPSPSSSLPLPPPPRPPVPPRPKPDPKPAPPIKPGHAPKPSGGGFKDVGKAVIHANKIKAHDELMMANLRKQAPISVAEAAKRVIDADSLVKSGVISTGPNALRVARDAAISAGITGLVSAPINVGAYAGSVAAGEKIKSSYAPGVLPPPFLPSATPSPKPDVPVGPVDSPPAPADTLGARLDDVEMKLLGMASTVMLLAGEKDRVYTKDERWPTDDTGRLSHLEKLLGLTEQQFKKAARQNGIVFKPYKPGEQIPADAKGRLDLIEKKLERMIGSYENLRLLAAVKASQRESEATATA